MINNIKHTTKENEPGLEVVFVQITRQNDENELSI